MVHHLQIKECFASSASLVCHLPPSFLMPALFTVALELLSTVWLKKTHLVIKVLFFCLSTLVVFEYIFTGFLQFCGFGCNSIYKSCYKKPLCKLYPSFMCHLCGSVPEPSHAVAQLLGADALSQLFSPGFAGPGTAASENSPKGSICCVLVAVHLDPLQMWQF